jgi:hypothetical protein
MLALPLARLSIGGGWLSGGVNQAVVIMEDVTMEYRGWTIHPAYIGYSATHNNYDAWTDDEGQWTDNGLCVHGMTLEQVKAEIVNIPAA